MAQAADTNRVNGQAHLTPLQAPSAANDVALHEALKRCPPSTYEAARLFRATGDVGHLPAIVHGIIERFVEPDLKVRLAHPDDDLRLIEDLGIDSLTLMEAVALAEDVLQITIDWKLGQVRTLGDVQRVVAGALGGLPPRPPAIPPNGKLGPRGIPHFPAPHIPLRSPAEYQLLARPSLRPKHLATERPERSG